MRKPKRMDPRVERTREKVLTAAHELLRKSGPGGLSYSAVAELSGVGRATLYRHWPDMDSLLHDLISARAASEHPRFTGEVAVDLQLALQRMRRRVGSADGRTQLLTMLERANRDAEARKRLRTMQRMMPVRRALDLAISNGQLPEDIDFELSMAQLVGPLLHRGLMAAGRVDDEFIESVVDSYLRGLP